MEGFVERFFRSAVVIVSLYGFIEGYDSYRIREKGWYGDSYLGSSAFKMGLGCFVAGCVCLSCKSSPLVTWAEFLIPLRLWMNTKVTTSCTLFVFRGVRVSIGGCQSVGNQHTAEPSLPSH